MIILEEDDRYERIIEGRKLVFDSVTDHRYRLFGSDVWVTCALGEDPYVNIPGVDIKDVEEIRTETLERWIPQPKINE